MRYLAVLAIALLPWPALALDEEEAHDLYVKCFSASVVKLLPHWCHDIDRLSDFAHQSCLKEAVAVQATARIRKPDQALQNARLDAQLVMFDQLRKYKADPGCDK